MRRRVSQRRVRRDQRIGDRKLPPVEVVETEREAVAGPEETVAEETVAEETAAEAVVEGGGSLADELEAEHGLKRETRFYPKEGHGRSLEASGAFATVREVHLHHVETTSVEAMIGGVESCGAVRALRRIGVTDEAMGLLERVSL